MPSSVEASAQRPFWSPWGDRLVATLAVGLALCLAWWWVGTFYLRLPLSTYLSWKPNDQPTQVPPNFPAALLDGHYFGDFQESRWWGLDILHGSSPYDFANIYPPFAPWVMVPFGALPLTPAFILYVIASTVALVVPAWLLLHRLRTSTRVLITSLVTVCTAPFLATIDRGNLQGIAIGLAGFALVAIQRRRTRTAAILIALAICLKPFFLVIVVIALARRRIRFALNALGAAIVISFVALALLPGGLAYNLGGIIASQKDALDGPDFAYIERIFANVGIRGLIANVELMARGPSDAPSVLDQVPSSGLLVAVVWTLLVALVAWRRRLPQWVWGPLGLAAIQLAQPYSSTYTLSWATLAAVWFGVGRLLPADLVGDDNDAEDRWTTSLRVLMLVALAVTLLPIAVRPTFGDVTVPVQQIASPVLWLGVGALALVASFARAAPAPTSTSTPVI